MTQELDLSDRDPFQLPDNPREMHHAPRALLAFEMAKAGCSWEVIQDKLNYHSVDTARNAVMSRISRYYKKTEDELNNIVEMELARLDALQLMAWRQAKDGNLAAMDRVLKVMEMRAKYLGLYTEEPQAQSVTNAAFFIGGSEDEYIEALKKMRKPEQLVNGSPNGPDPSTNGG